MTEMKPMEAPMLEMKPEFIGMLPMIDPLKPGMLEVKPAKGEWKPLEEEKPILLSVSKPTLPLNPYEILASVS